MAKSEKPTIFQAERTPLDVTFLVFSGSSIMCVASAIDPLRAANRIAGEDAVRLQARLGERRCRRSPPAACRSPSAASSIRPSTTDMLVVVAGFGTQGYATASFLQGFRRAARSARACGGVEAGTWLVGRAGLLEGRAATTHWEDMEDFAAAFPGTDVRPDRYVIDGPVFTTGGASPTFDLMLHLIRSRLGMAVGARCRQRLHLRPVARRDRRAAAGLARPARRLRSAPRPGDPADGGACRPAAQRRGDRQARRRHAAHAGKHLSQIDRRDAGRLLSPAAAECRAPAGGRHARRHGRHRRAHRLLVGRRVLAGVSRDLSAVRRRRCGEG